MQLFCYYFCIKNQPKIETKISMKCQLLEPGACKNPGIEEFGELFVRGELPFVIGKMGFPGRHKLGSSCNRKSLPSFSTYPLRWFPAWLNAACQSTPLNALNAGVSDTLNQAASKVLGLAQFGIRQPQASHGRPAISVGRPCSQHAGQSTGRECHQGSGQSGLCSDWGV